MAGMSAVVAHRDLYDIIDTARICNGVWKHQEKDWSKSVSSIGDIYIRFRKR